MLESGPETGNILDKVERLEKFIEHKEDLKREHPLRYLFWEATLRCNLNCFHCGSDCFKDNSTKSAELSPERVNRELDLIAEKHNPEKITFAIIGGEPLIRDDIYITGAHAADLGFFWGITTNAMLLNKERIMKLEDSGLQTISISLDGIGEAHDKLRNSPGAYNKVTNNIRLLLENKFFKLFDVICCVNKLNINELEEFVQEAINLGIPGLRFTPVFGQGRAGENDWLALDKNDYLKMLGFIKQKRLSEERIEITLSEEGYWGPEWECRIRDNFHYCASGILVGSILHNGDVIGCPSVSRSFTEGNINEKPFVDIWENGFDLYREDRYKVFESECGGCEHWELCEGGGFHLIEQKGVFRNICSYKKIKGDRML